MKTKLLKKVIACVLVISTLLAVSVVPAFANELRDTVEYDTVIDGLALHIEECNDIRKVTYIENDVMCVITFDGDNIQLSKNDEVVYTLSVSAQTPVVKSRVTKYENELMPQAATASGTVTKKVEGYYYSISTCNAHADVYCKIPSSQLRSFLKVPLRSTTMNSIDEFIKAVNKISTHRNKAAIYYTATEISVIIALCIAESTPAAAVLAALGLTVTGATAISDMLAAMNEADLAFIRIY